MKVAAYLISVFEQPFITFSIVALVYLCEGREGRKECLVRASLTIFRKTFVNWLLVSLTHVECRNGERLYSLGVVMAG